MELGIKRPKRPMVSAAAVAAGAVLENSSGAEGVCRLKQSFEQEPRNMC